MGVSYECVKNIELSYNALLNCICKHKVGIFLLFGYRASLPLKSFVFFPSKQQKKGNFNISLEELCEKVICYQFFLFVFVTMFHVTEVFRFWKHFRSAARAVKRFVINLTKNIFQQQFFLLVVFYYYVLLSGRVFIKNLYIKTVKLHGQFKCGYKTKDLSNEPVIC